MTPATPEAIARAAALLRAGGLVAFPTETVYGLGADATDGRAVARIFAAKGRPRFNPLISHVLDRAAGERQAIFDGRAVALAEAHWPGPLTLVLGKRDDCEISPLALCGLATVALRCPRGATARALLAATARPIAAPSANRSGGLSPTTAAHVAAGLGDAPDMILDGTCPVGVESTIVDLSVTPAALLRPGAVTAAEIAALIGPLAAAADDAAAPKAPGRLARHYAPKTPLRLNAAAAAPDEALLAFGPGAPGAAANLSPTGDLVEAAANLFAMLHALDAAGATAIAVMPIPDDGLGAAINDRLTRAATAPPRDTPEANEKH